MARGHQAHVVVVDGLLPSILSIAGGGRWLVCCVARGRRDVCTSDIREVFVYDDVQLQRRECHQHTQLASRVQHGHLRWGSTRVRDRERQEGIIWKLRNQRVPERILRYAKEDVHSPQFCAFGLTDKELIEPSRQPKSRASELQVNLRSMKYMGPLMDHMLVHPPTAESSRAREEGHHWTVCADLTQRIIRATCEGEVLASLLCNYSRLSPPAAARGYNERSTACPAQATAGHSEDNDDIRAV